MINGNNRSYYSGSRNYNSTSYRRGVGSSTTRPANSSVGQVFAVQVVQVQIAEL